MLVKKGDIIQVRDTDNIWGGVLLIIDEVYPWGVQAYAVIPGGDRAFIRLKHDEYYWCGMAFIMFDEDADDGD